MKPTSGKTLSGHYARDCRDAAAGWLRIADQMDELELPTLAHFALQQAIDNHNEAQKQEERTS